MKGVRIKTGMPKLPGLPRMPSVGAIIRHDENKLPGGPDKEGLVLSSLLRKMKAPKL